MKDQLEQSIKESLQGFEAPYNPAAWDAMRAQLDAKMPVNTPPTGGAAKWYIAAAVIGGIGVGSYFLFNTSDAETHTPAYQEVSAETTQNSNSNDNNEQLVNSNSSSIEVENASVTNANVDHTSNGNQANTPSQNVNVPSAANVPANRIGYTPGPGGDGNLPNNQGQPGHENPDQNAGNVAQNIELKLPEMEDVCQNSVITIVNSNKVPLVLIGPDVYQIIPAKETSKIRMKKDGDYVLSEYKNEKGKKVEFEVKKAPIADFSIDPMTKFEEGLPTTKLTANVPGTQFEWIISGERTYGAEADAHFYRQGTHDVTLVVTGSNGCEALQTKSVYIEDNYNLMAPTSFRPLSNDLSVNKFIPYALKERNVNFRMVIVDPADGHVIFETKDASMGWDGIDRKTGQLVPFEHVYIWKVTLDKAAKFEQRTEYSGQVIPVRAN